ncbi:MAG: methionine--tRNA ligase [Deltaproteobacteria bacterium]|nr:methionine--tRNA ligase [Deltaproteobacteria bacterium]
MTRRLVTSALPYANGDIHLGHLVEHLATDFWARFQKMRGHQCLTICADDTHGAPIMVAARKKGIAPEELIARTLQQHTKDFVDFQIHYDHYSTTHSETNRALCSHFYKKLKEGGHIFKRAVDQHYCETDKIFLPDRFVKGTCPRCGVENQYGDSCEACSAVYHSTELREPRCSICDSTPVVRASEQFFVKLEDFRPFLSEWVPQHTSAAVANKLQEWLSEELKDWCFTRDAPYFGFELPDAKGKYYYVWFDAPIGYVSSTKEWCEQRGLNFKDFWQNPEIEIHHNIGKDIVYFHTLFWPAMLKSAGFSTPTSIWVHGMLTVNGEKLSKSKGTFINARTYLNHLAPEYLRYYLACKLNQGVGDIDFNFEDFVGRVNSDLIGKITNIASRSAQMLHKQLEGRLAHLPARGEGAELIKKAHHESEGIAQLYEERNFAKALLSIRSLADLANKYFDDHKPWILVKEDKEKTREILTVALNLFRIVAVYLAPILPRYAEKVAQLFKEEPYTWESSQHAVENGELNPFSHLLSRLDPKAVEAIVEETKELQQKTS